MQTCQGSIRRQERYCTVQYCTVLFSEWVAPVWFPYQSCQASEVFVCCVVPLGTVRPYACSQRSVHGVASWSYHNTLPCWYVCFALKQSGHFIHKEAFMNQTKRTNAPRVRVDLLSRQLYLVLCVYGLSCTLRCCPIRWGQLTNPVSIPPNPPVFEVSIPQ